MSSIWFTGNFEDLSTDKGYQFRFRCEKCGNGYMSSFRVSSLGVASSALQAAGNLFGGAFGRAASSAYEVQRAVGGPAHDAALKEAGAEISKQFHQCSRCGNWVCGPKCWNEKAKLCEACAPDLEEEARVAKAGAARDQIHQKAREAHAPPPVAAAAPGAICAACGATGQSGKFCRDCGVALKRSCKACGVEVGSAAKFCPECGQRLD